MYSNLRKLEIRQLAGLFFLLFMVYSISLTGCTKKSKEAGGKKEDERTVAVKQKLKKETSMNLFR